MNVTQGVERHISHTSTHQQPLEFPQHIALTQRATVTRTENEIVVLPGRSNRQPLLVLLPPVLPQHRDTGGRQSSGASPGGSLRFTHHTVLTELTLHQQCASSQIHVSS